MKYVGWTVFVIAETFVLAIWRGWVLSLLWAWFIVPVFHAPALAIPYAIGISLIVAYLTYNSKRDEKRSWEDVKAEYWHAFTTKLTLPAITLATGWVVRMFV